MRLRNQIRIEFVSGRRGQFLPVGNVRISCWDRDPELAQKITARLGSLFMERESRTREAQVTGTTTFLDAELAKVAQQLKRSEDNLQSLKQRYRYELPSELETNLRTLDRLQLQKTGNVEALDRYTTMQLNLERQISETPATIPGDLPDAAAAAALPRDPRIDTYLKKEQEYNELIIKATENHPDVQRLKADLEQLKREIVPEDLQAAYRPGGTKGPVTVPNPVYQNLAAQARQLKTEIEIREREKKWIDNEMAAYTRRVTNTPRVEQEMAAIVRANEDLTRQHEDLKAKLSQARLAESLESRDNRGQFTVVDPANYPLEPATPSRKVFFLVGSVISLGIGLGAAFIVGRMDERVWTQAEVERFLDAPVLVEIPNISSRSEILRERRKKQMHGAMLLLFTGIYVGGLYSLYLNQPQLLRALDPVLETMMERMIPK